MASGFFDELAHVLDLNSNASRVLPLADVYTAVTDTMVQSIRLCARGLVTLDG
jgi:hypothetical protein